MVQGGNVVMRNHLFIVLSSEDKIDPRWLD
jgi:hypothetical protein